MHPPADLLIILQVAFLSIGLTLNVLAWATGVFPINVLGVCFTVYGMLMSPRIHLPAAFFDGCTARDAAGAPPNHINQQ